MQKTHLKGYKIFSFSLKIKKKYEEEFYNAVEDDLNMPLALSVLWAVLRDKELGFKEKLELVYDFDQVLGLGLDALEADFVPSDIMKLVEEREQARKDKDWAKSDKLRDKIKLKGYIIEDIQDGVKVKRD